jgi:O-antigen ligase
VNSHAAPRTQPLLVAAGAVLIMSALGVATLGLATGPTAKPFVIVAAAAGVLLLARWPQWIMPAFIVVTWSLVDSSDGAGRLGTVAPKGVLALALLALVLMPTRPRAARAALIAMAFFALPLVASWLAGAGQPAFPDLQLRDLLFLGATAMLVGGTAGIERSAFALTLLGIGLSIGAVYSVRAHPFWVFVLDGPVTSTDVARAAGPFGESNFFALSLATLVPFALRQVARGGSHRAVGIVALPALAAGLLATGSRGGLIAAGVALLGSAVLGGTRTMRIACVAALLVALAATQLFSAQLNDASSRTIGGRETENTVAIAMFKDHPLLGVGPGEYPVFYRDYARYIGNDPRAGREAHSLPLEIAAEQGIAGIVGWVLALGCVLAFALRAGVQRTPVGRMVLVATGTFLVGSLFLHGSVLRLLFVLLGMLVALGSEEREPEPA